MATASLQQRNAPLASPQAQLALLESLDLSSTCLQGDFNAALQKHGWENLTPSKVEILQINLGKLCNMTCRHCHVDAGPDRKEIMTKATVDACLALLDHTEVHTVDLTGGAPELNPHFRYLVDQCVLRGKQVIDRCNLTVLLLPTLQDLPEWMAERGVEVVCSLPHYRQVSTDAQRGDGTFDASIVALKRLNALGYGQGNPHLKLTLVTNPVEVGLSCTQTAQLEKCWKEGLAANHGITFDRLIAINNMPISRHLEWLEASGQLQSYMELLVNAFNPATIAGLMCRNTFSIGWDGALYDCDFNQMLELSLLETQGHPLYVQGMAPTSILASLSQRQIRTDRHCFGCTAGSGSSCGGALA